LSRLGTGSYCCLHAASPVHNMCVERVWVETSHTSHDDYERIRRRACSPARISPASNRVRHLLPSRHRLHACSPAPPCPHAPLHSKSAGRKPKAQHACLGLHIRLGFYAIFHGFAFPVPLVWASRVHAHKRPSGLSHYYRKGRVCFSQNQLIPCVCAPLGSSTVLQAQRRRAHSTFSTLPRHPSGGPETT
jgi:hypothetical protein